MGRRQVVGGGTRYETTRAGGSRTLPASHPPPPALETAEGPLQGLASSGGQKRPLGTDASPVLSVAGEVEALLPLRSDRKTPMGARRALANSPASCPRPTRAGAVAAFDNAGLVRLFVQQMRAASGKASRQARFVPARDPGTYPRRQPREQGRSRRGGYMLGRSGSSERVGGLPVRGLAAPVQESSCAPAHATGSLPSQLLPAPRPQPPPPVPRAQPA